MIVFACTKCRTEIAAADNDPAGIMVKKLNEHITQCPPASFTFDGTTDHGRERLDLLRSVLTEWKAKFG